MGALAVFMDRKALNRILDYDDDYFAGYLSEKPINDIKDEYIGSVIDFDALNKTSRQLTISMGEMMNMVNVFAMVIFTVLLYLLGKIIIEKNAQSISISKILGYSNPEISGLYIVTTSIVVVLLLLITLPLESFILIRIFRVMIIQMMSGWMPLVIERRTFVQAFLMGVGVYAVVAMFEYRKVRKVPMGEALKNIE
jgi:putative ABC transport system permease protein